MAAGAAVASAAVLGGGLPTAATGILAVGVVGALMGLVIHESDADVLEDEIDQGRLLLFVRTRGAEDEDNALAIMRRHEALHSKVCTVSAAE